MDKLSPHSRSTNWSYFTLGPLPWWQAFLLAAALQAIAAMVRMGLNSATFSEAPYSPFVIAVLIAAAWGSRFSAIAAALIGGPLAFKLVVYRGPADVTHLRGVILYFILCAILIAVVSAMKDAMARAAALNEQLVTVSRELHHRMKNVVTLAISITQQTARNVSSTAEFESKVTARLVALGRAQDLLIASEGSAVSLSTLVDQVLSPFDVPGHLVTPIAGPPVNVPPDVATSLAMLLNELATNATKYGALSVAEGRLDLTWAAHKSRTMITWCESGGPPVTAPSKLGFGSRLFKSSLARERGAVDIAYDQQGVRCDITLEGPPSSTGLR